MNLTDNEIKKVLECCSTNGLSCKDCPAFVKVDRSNCKKYFREAVKLINRLEAEIETKDNDIKVAIEYALKLEKRIKDYIEEIKLIRYCNKVNILSAKAEARKEIAEKIKGLFCEEDDVRAEIDDLLKEMIDENTAK